jgi:hypothetical protein
MVHRKPCLPVLQLLKCCSGTVHSLQLLLLLLHWLRCWLYASCCTFKLLLLLVWLHVSCKRAAAATAS